MDLRCVVVLDIGDVMFDIFGNLGHGVMSNLGGTGHMAQQNASQAGQYGGSQLQNAYPGYAHSLQQASQLANLGAGQQSWSPAKPYMLNGKAMDFEEFINTLYPEDCAEKTMMILKLKKED